MTGVNRCKYIHDDGWGKDNCCWRPTWENHDACIWHAGVSGKETETIRSALKTERKAARVAGGTERTIRLDGAVLSDTVLDESIVFDGCTLNSADFADADVPWDRHPELEMPWAPYTDIPVSAPSFRGADLRGATLDDADFPEADFSGADFRGASLKRIGLADACLPGANLRSANLGDGYLGNADLTESVLLESNFTGATLSRATIVNAHAERAIFTQADLVQVDFRGTALSTALFSEARVSANTEFGDRCVYDPRSEYDRSPELIPDELAQGYERAPLVKAEWVYRRLEQLCRENSLTQRARWYYGLSKDMNRRMNWEASLVPHLYNRLFERSTVHQRTKEGATLPSAVREPAVENASVLQATKGWGRAAISGFVMRYGNSPIRVVLVSLLAIVSFAVIYPVGGLQSETGTLAYPSTPFSLAAITETVTVLKDSLSFSLLTFTSIGSSSTTPIGLSRPLMGIESLLGALLLALLVFVLGRRATL